jgi:hypothetical protein
MTMSDIKISAMPVQSPLIGTEYLPAVDLTLPVAQQNRRIQIQSILPSDGTINQIPAKASSNPYDIAWVDPPSPSGGQDDRFYCATLLISAEDGLVLLPSGLKTANTAAWTGTYVGPGQYQVNHDLGTALYNVQALLYNGFFRANIFCFLRAKTDSMFEVCVNTSLTGLTADTDSVDILVMKP